jgi:hypothetical protein
MINHVEVIVLINNVINAFVALNKTYKILLHSAINLSGVLLVVNALFVLVPKLMPMHFIKIKISLK